MTYKLKSVIILVALFMPVASIAQTDHFGAVDTVWAEVTKIDDLNWSIHISYFNDENVIAMSVPLKMKAGLNRIVADSCIFTGGRVEHFSRLAFRADTSIQCVTLGMMASLTASGKTLSPGKGRLATIFVSSIIDEPIKNLKVDTTTTNPNNILEIIADSVQGDSTKIKDMKKRTIYPAFVIKQSK